MFDDSEYINQIIAESKFPKVLASISSIEEIENLYMEIKKPNFYLKDLGITARVLAHWKENGLLPPAKREDLGWNCFDFAEYIWIRIIQDLRNFGMSLPKIKNVKDYLLTVMDTDTHRPSTQDILEFTERGLEFTELGEKEKKQVVSKMTESSGFEEMKSFISTQLKIEMMLFTCIIYKLKIGILIDKEGRINDWVGVDIESYNTAYSQTELFISISDFVFEFMNDVTKEKFIVPLNILTKEELEVLRAIRRNDLTEVVIKFPLKSGRKKWKIQTKKNVGLPKDVQLEISQHLNLKNYQSINIKNDSGTLYCEKTHTKTL